MISKEKIPEFIRIIEQGIEQINDVLDTFKALEINTLDGEFYLPEIPEIYNERIEMLQENLDVLTKRIKNR